MRFSERAGLTAAGFGVPRTLIRGEPCFVRRGPADQPDPWRKTPRRQERGSARCKGLLQAKSDFSATLRSARLYANLLRCARNGYLTKRCGRSRTHDDKSHLRCSGCRGFCRSSFDAARARENDSLSATREEQSSECTSGPRVRAADYTGAHCLFFVRAGATTAAAVGHPKDISLSVPKSQPTRRVAKRHPGPSAFGPPMARTARDLSA